MPIPLLLHGRHGDPTVTYQPLGEWLVPWRFSRLEDEYQALRTGVGLIDYSTQGLVECRGADRIDFLHRLLTNDIKRLRPGAGCQAALLTASAKLIADLLVLADPEAAWLLTSLPRAEGTARVLEQYVFTEQVTIVNHERRVGVLAITGPRTLDCLAQVFARPIALPNAGAHLQFALHDVPLRLIRHAVCGGIGVLCLAPSEHLASVWEALRDRGRPFHLAPVGWEALSIARIEAGVPWFGIDMDETTLLPETGLEAEWASATKGCYVGQEIIARVATYGSVNKKLMGLLIEGDRVPEPGEAIWREREEVGRVTSACWSPALRRPIGMGYVKRGAYEPGTRVEIVHGASRLTSTVVARPPYSCQ